MQLRKRRTTNKPGKTDVSDKEARSCPACFFQEGYICYNAADAEYCWKCYFALEQADAVWVRHCEETSIEVDLATRLEWSALEIWVRNCRYHYLFVRVCYSLSRLHQSDLTTD